ncbi:MAG TPA: DUF5611 family protein [Thermoplasmata archaeon]|nr:DUF5611 family protein [Thermoplasmata archaeon]
MQKYPVRPTHRPNLAPEVLERILRVHFDSVAGTGPERTASWGAIAHLSARADGRDLLVEVTMNPKVAEEVARETIARYNRFLEEASGYTTKERAKRLKKSATTPTPGE